MAAEEINSEELRAPFPWFGGKSRVAADVWARFGNVRNYVEPFFGSGAVFLARPAPFDGVETINDADGFVANFWRAVKSDPQGVVEHLDWPVNEADLHARHYWLVTQGREILAGVLGDPDAYDVKIAGWWCWGLCSWIAGGWCDGTGPWQFDGGAWIKRRAAGQSIKRRLPHLGDAGRGINRQLPHLGDAGQGINSKRPLLEWIVQLSQRLRNVRVCCGDWSRVTGDSVTFRHGLTAVFLDPPYSNEMRESGVYAHDCGSVAADARAWAIELGERADMRIALCGYDNEHAMPSDWEAFSWETKGGYGSRGDGRGRENRSREVIWFSPACLKPASADADLFAWSAP